MSIKSNRHTMAAFLVAILCITTIFSLFPVTAFAACSHPSSSCIPYYLDMGSYHSVEVVCWEEGCEETVSEYDELHSYNSKGECVCGSSTEVPAVTTTVSSSGGGSLNPTPGCEHPEWREYWECTPITSNTHKRLVKCGVCEELLDTISAEACTFNANGICGCGNKRDSSGGSSVVTTKPSTGGSSNPSSSCSHYNVIDYYSPNNDGTHRMERVCLSCERTLVDMDLPCNYMNNGVCEDCAFDKAECFHMGEKDRTHTPNFNGTHTTVIYCYTCYKVASRDTVICTYVNGYCMYCGASVDNSDGGTVCTHTVTNTYYCSNNDGTHRMETVCLTCEKTLIDKDVPCNYMNNGVCKDCTFDKGDCSHSGNVDITYVSTGAGRHYVKKYCYTCYKYFSVELVDCVMLKGICTLCGYTCPHPESDVVIKYYSLADGNHEYTEFCNSCECVIYDRVEECTFELFRCIHCFYYQPKVGIYEDVPKNAKAAYVYQDDDGNWLVKCDTYYGGVNRLNLLACDFYVHNNSSVKVTHYTSNSVVVQDLDGAVNKSNSKIIDVSGLPCNNSVFEEGVSYKFVATVDSPCSDSQILLKVSSSSGTKYLNPGDEFVYEKGMSLYLNIKTNKSTTKSYGIPFTVTITDIGIIPSGEYYEPYGIRYFNGDLSLVSYQNLKYFYIDLARALGLLDYIGGVAYGNTKFSSYKDLLHKYNHNSEYSHFFDLYYGNGKNLASYDKFNIYDKFVSSSDSSYNLGYSDGYSSAVHDFEDVTDGGMVEGLINGAFNSVSDSWDILNSGVSISGISVGGIVSTVAILVVVYFALKIIAR